MDVITLAWVVIGLVGLVFGGMVLREVLADWRASLRGSVSPAARAFLKESIRGIWFQLVVLTALVGAAVPPTMFPVAQRPVWVRHAAIGLLVLAEVLLSVNLALMWRAKRRFLAQHEQRPDRRQQP